MIIPKQTPALTGLNYNPNKVGLGTAPFVEAIKKLIEERAYHHKITPDQYKGLLGWL